MSSADPISDAILIVLNANANLSSYQSQSFWFTSVTYIFSSRVKVCTIRFAVPLAWHSSAPIQPCNRIERSEKIWHEPRLSIVTDCFTPTEPPEHTFLISLCNRLRSSERTRLRDHISRKISSYSSHFVFPLNDRNNEGCDPQQLPVKDKLLLHFLKIPLEILDAFFQSHYQHFLPHNVGHSGMNLYNESLSRFFDRCGPSLDVLLTDLCGSDVETLVARASARPNVKAPYVLQHYMLFSDSKIAAHSHPLRNQARFSHSFFSSFIRGDTSQSDTFLV